jgi:hypothetical protein
MLNFIQRNYYKSKLAIFDSSPPPDKKLIELKATSETAQKDVVELKNALQGYVQKQLAMCKQNQKLSGILDKFFNNSPARATQQAVESYTQVHSLFDTNTLALFKDGLQNNIWVIFAKWFKENEQLQAQLWCLEQARIYVYAQKFHVKDLQNARDAKIDKGEDFTSEEASVLQQQQRELAHLGSALEYMYARVVAEGDRLVQPMGLYTIFDDVLMSFIHFQTQWFKVGIQLTETFQPLISSFRETLKIREQMADIKSESTEATVTHQWTVFNSGKEALEEISLQMKTKEVVETQQESEAGVLSFLDAAMDSEQQGDSKLVSETPAVVAATTAAVATETASTSSVEPSTPVEAAAEPEPAPKPTAEIAVAAEVVEAQVDSKTVAVVAGWSEKVKTWQRAAGGVNDPETLVKLLSTLDSVLFTSAMEWTEGEQTLTEFAQVSKAYRKAVAMFSPYKQQPDSMSSEDFTLVTKQVTTTLKKSYMAYRGVNA